MKNKIVQIFSFLGVTFGVGLLFVQCSRNSSVPAKWRQQWESPSVDYRPLQIVHGADIREKASYYKDSCGLGGVVCNVPFGNNYLKSEEDWKIFVDGVKSMRSNGLRVWIYDEDGYPSLGAGGRVLEADSTLEALEMVYDKENKNHFTVRRCYEYTHACNNFYVARRYPNPLNPAATEKFLEVTHRAYLDHLGSVLFGEVEAFFTDEPSMMAVNLGQLREDVRKNVKVIDSLDFKKKYLPMVSWMEDLPEKYKSRYGEDLMPNLASIFTGNSEKDKRVRQNYWSLLASLDREYYYNAIRDWCNVTRENNGGKGPVSSGHGLREENPSSHVALDGNKLLVLSGLDIPGLDQLSSDPTIWQDNSWMATFFPASSAELSEQRRIMCEMSDFDQTLNGKGPADLQHMQAASAWQMAFGVTDFNLYYTINNGDKYPNRKEAAYREYCDFVGRINSIVKEAVPVRKVLLYYPIYDLQREYIPTAEKVSWRTQSDLTKTLEFSFRDLGANLLKAQTQFVLVDYLTLGRGLVNEDGTIQVGQNSYSAIVFPKGVTLPSNVSALMEQAKSKGVKLFFANDFSEIPTPEHLSKFIGVESSLSPAAPNIAFGAFTREKHTIYLLVNTGKEQYSGELAVSGGKGYVELDPATGNISKRDPLSGNKIPIVLEPLQTKLVMVQ